MTNAPYDWEAWDPPAPPAWPIRRVSMTITHLVIAILLTFVIGWLVGQMTPSVDYSHPKVPPRTSIDIQNAQNYADWCGGYVQTLGQDRTVQGCDR